MNNKLIIGGYVTEVFVNGGLYDAICHIHLIFGEKLNNKLVIGGSVTGVFVNGREGFVWCCLQNSGFENFGVGCY